MYTEADHEVHFSDSFSSEQITSVLFFSQPTLLYYFKILIYVLRSVSIPYKLRLFPWPWVLCCLAYLFIFHNVIVKILGTILTIYGLEGLLVFSSVQSLSHVQLFATPWTAACQASPFIINSQSPPKPMSIVLGRVNYVSL